jgi:hypothetical protein
MRELIIVYQHEKAPLMGALMVIEALRDGVDESLRGES